MVSMTAVMTMVKGIRTVTSYVIQMIPKVTLETYMNIGGDLLCWDPRMYPSMIPFWNLL